MNPLTPADLAKIIPNNKRSAEWHSVLIDMFDQYEINTVERMAMFLAQCAHESAEFTQLVENLNYRAATLVKIWPKHWPNETVAKEYEFKPQMIANKAYANRMGNGDQASGDGFRYCGRGMIQITGKYNYQKFADSIKRPLSEMPAYLETMKGAAEGACWFWTANRLNSISDTGDVAAVTKIINGGLHGLDDRKLRYTRALALLKDVKS